MRFEGEEEDLIKAKEIADKWGYGNLIAFLRENWADNLVEHGLDPYAAGLGACMDKHQAKIYSKNKHLTSGNKERLDDKR